MNTWLIFKLNLRDDSYIVDILNKFFYMVHILELSSNPLIKDPVTRFNKNHIKLLQYNIK
jgi:hypothetical protein